MPHPALSSPAEQSRCEVRLLPESSRHSPGGKAVHLSVLSCTTRGFSCARLYSRTGGLLPRHFTLTQHYFRPGAPGLEPSPSENGAGRYIFCDTFRRLRLALPVARAFARRATYRCSDFPLPQIALRAAIACHAENYIWHRLVLQPMPSCLGVQAKRSIRRAKVKSTSVRPPAECVAKVSFTLFHRISISGW
jgi:hypothetical protein